MQFDFSVMRRTALSKLAWWPLMHARRQIFLSTIHTRSAGSLVRQIISRMHTIGNSKLAPILSSTIALPPPRIYAEDASFETPRQVDAEVGLYAHLAPVFISFFFPRAFQPSFLCLPSCRLWIAINRRDSRGTRTLRFFLHLMPCATYILAKRAKNY